MTDIEAITQRRSVDVADVATELAELWRHADDSDEGAAVVRACGLTIVAMAHDPEEGDEIAALLASATAMVPARTLVVVRNERAEGGLSASVSAFCSLGPGGKQVCQEQVFLEADPDHWPALPSLIGALPVADLPVVLLARDPAQLDDPTVEALLPAIDLVVTDLARGDVPHDDLNRARAVLDESNVALRDLAFERLVVWRSAIACAWDRVAVGSTSLRAVAMSGPEDDLEATLLTAWIESLLRHEPSPPKIARSTDANAPHLRAVRLEFEVDGRVEAVGLERHGEHVVERRRDDDEHGSCALPRPIPSDAELLPGLLADPQSDPIHVDALRRAAD